MGIEIPNDMLRRLIDLRMQYFTMKPCKWNAEYRIPESIYIQTGEASGISPELGRDSCMFEDGSGVVTLNCKFVESTMTRDYEYSFDCLAIDDEVVYVLDALQSKPAGQTLSVTLSGEARVY